MSANIIFNNPYLGQQVSKAAGTTYNPAVDINACRVRDDELLGGVLWTNYTGESMGIHTASWDEHWLNRDMLFVAFHYPFIQLGVQRLFSQMPEDNTKVLEFNRKLGFQHVARIEGVYRNGVACILTKLEAKDCKYLNIKPRHVKSNTIN